LQLHNPIAAQMDVLKIILESLMNFRRALLQLAACGDVRFTIATQVYLFGLLDYRSCNNDNTLFTL
jgi:hypothetical protein